MKSPVVLVCLLVVVSMAQSGILNVEPAMLQKFLTTDQRWPRAAFCFMGLVPKESDKYDKCQLITEYMRLNLKSDCSGCNEREKTNLKTMAGALQEAQPQIYARFIQI
ncbi:unnamed protein product [Meganyctiphanes norvegica]|uniref:Chemosensory protein n=1 Tax=Meganyctiphanes norvegica TaxID=48144 RepID=A0AAV2RQL1_MEGNR